MIFNKDILFIHLGKTGGMSVASYLCQALQAPVVSVSPFFNEKTKQEGHEILVKGKRHGNLGYAKKILAKYGINIFDLKQIIIVVRNPIDLEFSYYKHLKKPSVIKRKLKSENGKKALEFAQKSFNEFALSSITHFDGELKDYFLLDGQELPNLKVVKFENLAADIKETVKNFSIEKEIEFPHKNQNNEGDEMETLSDLAVQNIKNKYGYIYEKGFY
jgi:hypothetical protein